VLDYQSPHDGVMAWMNDLARAIQVLKLLALLVQKCKHCRVTSFASTAVQTLTQKGIQLHYPLPKNHAHVPSGVEAWRPDSALGTCLCALNLLVYAPLSH
jgi:hypothetical protein